MKHLFTSIDAFLSSFYIFPSKAETTIYTIYSVCVTL